MRIFRKRYRVNFTNPHNGNLIHTHETITQAGAIDFARSKGWEFKYKPHDVAIFKIEKDGTLNRIRQYYWFGIYGARFAKWSEKS